MPANLDDCGRLARAGAQPRREPDDRAARCWARAYCRARSSRSRAGAPHKLAPPPEAWRQKANYARGRCLAKLRGIC